MMKERGGGKRGLLRDGTKHGTDFTGRPRAGLEIGKCMSAERRVECQCASPVIVVEVLVYFPFRLKTVHALVFEVTEGYILSFKFSLGTMAAMTHVAKPSLSQSSLHHCAVTKSPNLVEVQ